VVVAASGTEGVALVVWHWWSVLKQFPSEEEMS